MRSPKYKWFQRESSNLGYASLLKIALGTHDIWPLLDEFKNAPQLYSSEDKEEMADPKGAFFRKLRWGMQENDGAMGYNLGDVIGLALIIRMLRESDDRKL